MRKGRSPDRPSLFSLVVLSNFVLGFLKLVDHVPELLPPVVAQRRQGQNELRPEAVRFVSQRFADETRDLLPSGHLPEHLAVPGLEPDYIYIVDLAHQIHKSGRRFGDAVFEISYDPEPYTDALAELRLRELQGLTQFLQAILKFAHLYHLLSYIYYTTN